MAKIASHVREAIGPSQAARGYAGAPDLRSSAQSLARIDLPDGGNGLDDDGTPEIIKASVKALSSFGTNSKGIPNYRRAGSTEELSSRSTNTGISSSSFPSK